MTKEYEIIDAGEKLLIVDEFGLGVALSSDGKLITHRVFSGGIEELIDQNAPESQEKEMQDLKNHKTVQVQVPKKGLFMLAECDEGPIPVETYIKVALETEKASLDFEETGNIAEKYGFSLNPCTDTDAVLVPGIREAQANFLNTQNMPIQNIEPRNQKNRDRSGGGRGM